MFFNINAELAVFDLRLSQLNSLYNTHYTTLNKYLRYIVYYTMIYIICYARHIAWHPLDV